MTTPRPRPSAAYVETLRATGAASIGATTTQRPLRGNRK